MREAVSWLLARFEPDALVSASDLAPLVDVMPDSIVVLCNSGVLPFAVEHDARGPRVRCRDVIAYWQACVDQGAGASAAHVTTGAPGALSTSQIYGRALFQCELRGQAQIHALEHAFERLLQEVTAVHQADADIEQVCLEWLDRKSMVIKLRSKAIAAQLASVLGVLSDAPALSLPQDEPTIPHRLGASPLRGG